LKTFEKNRKIFNYIHIII